MIRTLFLIALLTIAAGPVHAVPLAFERGPGLGATLAGPPADAAPAAAAPRARTGLFARGMDLPPSDRPALNAAWAMTHPTPPAPRPAAPPVVLPLPGAMPHFLVALAALALVAVRRRRAGALAGRRAAT